MAAKTYVRQNSHNRSISLPCGPVCMEAEYNKLMGQDDEPSSPTSDVMEEDGVIQSPPSRRALIIMVTSMVFIFMAIFLIKQTYNATNFNKNRNRSQAETYFDRDQSHPIDNKICFLFIKICNNK
ncbi:hypothetical protein QVD17_06361 [Tagetes erecta]|uniref:Uncharacterized protein n=1 Tax=Tagetes erecta TaxID=13708 RepID=A0AAD8LFW3_TARER|nr:hypothetical protein QVD17_06361 [Tagetes erecta]